VAACFGVASLVIWIEELRKLVARVWSRRP
jgi:hypothetical protein